MAEPYNQRLEVKIEGQPDNAFAVFRMSGREAISELFRFELDMLSDDADVGLSGIAGKGAARQVLVRGRERKPCRFQTLSPSWSSKRSRRSRSGR